jgi:hypothetical protein
MIVRVVMSRATRVPLVSFSLSSLVRTPTTYLGPLLALTMTVVTRDGLMGGLDGRQCPLMVIGLKEEGLGDCLLFRGLLVRTSFLVELAEHFSDDLPHALQRLEVILGLVELLLGVLHLIAELTNPRVELLFVWCGSRWSVGRSVGGGDFSDLFPTRVP